jgi:hypothetical protein
MKQVQNKNFLSVNKPNLIALMRSGELQQTLNEAVSEYNA